MSTKTFIAGFGLTLLSLTLFIASAFAVGSGGGSGGSAGASGAGSSGGSAGSGSAASSSGGSGTMGGGVSNPSASSGLGTSGADTTGAGTTGTGNSLPGTTFGNPPSSSTLGGVSSSPSSSMPSSSGIPGSSGNTPSINGQPGTIGAPGTGGSTGLSPLSSPNSLPLASSANLPNATTPGALGGAGATQSMTDSTGGSLNSSMTGSPLNSNLRNSGAGGTGTLSPTDRSFNPRGEFNAQSNLTGRAGMNARQEVRPGDDRMTFYNGEWWFYSPNNTWMYYRNNQWYPYSAQQYMPSSSYTAGYRGVMGEGGAGSGIYVDENGRRYRRDYTPDASVFRNQSGGATVMTAPNQMGTPSQTLPATPMGAAGQTPGSSTFEANPALSRTETPTP